MRRSPSSATLRMVHDLGARDNKGAELTATFETALAATARRTAVDNQGIA